MQWLRRPRFVIGSLLLALAPLPVSAKGYAYYFNDGGCRGFFIQDDETGRALVLYSCDGGETVYRHTTIPNSCAWCHCITV